MPELIVKLEDTVLQTVKFDGELLRIGRSRENDIVLENLSVSRQHGQIRLHDGRFILTDMNSANGILLNGVRVTKTEIVDEDVITIGKHKLIFQADLAESPTVIDDPSATRPPYKRPPALEARPDAWLTVESGRLKEREFRITRFETSLGKATSNDVVLTDDWLLGKKQAIILRKGKNEFEIQDLGGLRRVKVNGTIISERTDLTDGDLLELGGTKLIFHVANPHAKPVITPPVDLITLAEKNSIESADAGAMKSAAVVPQQNFADNESLDLEEFEGSMTGSYQNVLPPSATESNNTARPSANENNQRKGGRGRRNARAAYKASAQKDSLAAETNSAAPDVAGEPEAQPSAAAVGVDEKEVKMWEAALQNGSPAIRRQAARTLKKLTGRDYEA